MSKFDFKKLREQCQTTGKMLQETFKGTDNYLQGIADRTNDWKENVINSSKERTKNKNWQESNRQRWNNIEWKKNHSSKINEAMQTDSYKNNHAIGVAKRTEDPAWHEANRKSKFKPIITPYGIFDSLYTATNEIFNQQFLPTRKTKISVKAFIRSRLKDNPTEFYYITVEEYTRLTGKEL